VVVVGLLLPVKHRVSASAHFLLHCTETTAEGTLLTITEDDEVYNPIYRFVSRFIIGHTQTIDSYLNDLAIAIEHE